MKPLIKCC